MMKVCRCGHDLEHHVRIGYPQIPHKCVVCECQLFSEQLFPGDLWDGRPLTAGNVVALIHGFADFSGRWTTDKFRPFLEKAGLTVVEQDYGFSLAPNIFDNERESTKLAHFNPGFVIAHSNGSRIVQMASWKGLTSRLVILINPALDTKAKFGPGLKKILVLHTPSDKVLLLASLIPFHPWGKMGRVGYEGDDKRVENWDMRTSFVMVPWRARVKTHLGIFRKKRFLFWAQGITKLMRAEMKEVEA